MWFADSPELYRALAKILARAMTDADFRALCLTDPAAAYTLAAGGVPPRGLHLRFKEGTGMELVVGLPEPRTDEMPLSERELDQVAGGAANITGDCNNTCVYNSCD